MSMAVVSDAVSMENPKELVEIFVQKNKENML
jgi:hypothetical protein